VSARDVMGAVCFWVIVLAVLLVASCSPGFRSMFRPAPSPEGSKEAVELVWRTVYGRKEPPPGVFWIGQEELNCRDGKGFRAVTIGNDCVGGVTYVPWAVTVALPDNTKIHETALAHELWHAAMMLDGIADPYHKSPGFGPGGMVEQANRALEVAGL